MAEEPSVRVATDAERAAGAACRICFQRKGSGPLIAPCRCTGSQQWVHRGCLQRWQRIAGRTGNRSNASACSVCTADFELPPPPPPRLDGVRAGDVLVATSRLGGRFHRSVILLGQVTTCGTHGVVLNVPHEPSDELRAACATAAGEGLSSESNCMAVEWRRGGPVCSGRLGVVGYALLHTLRTSSTTSIELLSEPASEADRRSVTIDAIGGEPASHSEAELPRVIARVRREGQGGTRPAWAFAFMGYCRWGANQLAQEFAAGKWAICSAAVEDVLDVPIERMWSRLCESSRLRYADESEDEDSGDDDTAAERDDADD